MHLFYDVFSLLNINLIFKKVNIISGFYSISERYFFFVRIIIYISLRLPSHFYMTLINKRNLLKIKDLLISICMNTSKRMLENLMISINNFRLNNL